MVRALILLFSFFHLLVFSQDQYIFDNLNIEDGLSQSSALSICEDFNKRIIIGTEEGLNVFDGEEVNIYYRGKKGGLTNNHINCLKKSEFDSLVYIGTNGSGICYLKNDTIKDISAIPDIIVNDIQETKDYLIISSDNFGCVLINKKTYQVEELASEEEVRFSFYSSVFIENNRFLLASKEGVFELDILKKTLLRSASFSKKIQVNALSFNQDTEQLLVGTFGEGLWEAQHGITRALPLQMNSKVREIYFDKETGYHWVGTEKGLYVIHKQDIVQYFEMTENSLGIQSDRIMDIQKSSQGIILVGTYGFGTYFFYETSFKTYSIFTNPPISSNSIWYFHPLNQNEMLIGSGKGVDILDVKSNKINPFNIPNFDLSSYEILCIQEDEINLYLGTFGNGIIVIQKKNKTFYFINSQSEGFKVDCNVIRNMYQDNSGFLWVGTYGNGLFRLDLKNKQSVHLGNHPELAASIIDNHIFDFYEDAYHKLYVGSYGGLGVIDMNTNETFHFNIDNSVDSEKLYSVLDINKVNDSLLLISTNVGLHEFNPISNEYLKSYTLAEGLITESVYGSLVADNGDIWISGNKGLGRISNQDQSISYYSKFDGLQSDEFNGTAFCKMKSDLYFGGVNGFNRFDPDSISANKKMNPLVVDNFKINQTIVNELDLDKIELSSDQNSISFHFYSPNLDPTINLNYSYSINGKRFEGFQKGPDVNLVNLKPGKYKLELKVYSSNKISLSETKTFKFKVPFPFWMSKWFVLISAILLGVLIYIIFKVRFKLLLKQRRSLENLVYSRTKELSEANESIYSSIRYALKLQKSMLPNSEIQNEEVDLKVLFKPRDIVSGDYYFFEDLSDDVVFGLGDGTGHGIPGGMIANSCIQSIKNSILIEEITAPGKIFFNVAMTLEKLLNPGKDSHDGTEVSICSVNKQTKKLSYNNSGIRLYLFSSSERKFQELARTNRFGAGVTNKKLLFNCDTIQLNSGDQLFMFSDGLTDQFGGPKYKKYSTGKLVKVLSDNAGKNITEIHEVVEAEFNNWKEDASQIDDISFMAIEIK